MEVRFLNLSVENRQERNNLLNAIKRVFIHGRIVLGPEVEELEKKIAEFSGTEYAVGVNSGTDALYLAFRSLNIGPGDEVITTCLSWIATANAIKLTGAEPVFVDIRKDFNINPDKIEESITPHTKAIVPVHFTGKVCDMTRIMEIAEKYNLWVVEDAAQAIGATYKGKKAGSFGRVSALSLNPMKVLAACGEAGMVLTNDETIYEKTNALRYNGTTDRTEAHYISLNGRIDTIQAAIILERFKYIDDYIQKRREAAAYYSRFLAGTVSVPEEDNNCRNVFYTYNILCENRDELQKYLTEKGIETKIHHPLLMPMHNVYRKYAGDSSKWPVGVKITKKSLCLPIHEKITREEQDYVIESVRTFYS